MAPSPSGRRPGLLAAGKPDRIGRVQLNVRRAFVATAGRPLMIRDLLPRCYPRAESYTRWQRWSIHRAVRRFGVSTGRAESLQGRPVVWVPSAELMRLIRGSNC